MPPKAVSFLAIALVAIVFITFVILQVIPATIPPPLTAGPALPMGATVPDDGTETEAPPPASTTAPNPEVSPQESLAPSLAAGSPEAKERSGLVSKYGKEPLSLLAKRLAIPAKSLAIADTARLAAILQVPKGTKATALSSGEHPVLGTITPDAFTLSDLESGQVFRRLRAGKNGQVSVEVPPSPSTPSLTCEFSAVAFHPSEAIAAIGTSDGYVFIWSYLELGRPQALNAFKGNVTAIGFNGAGTSLGIVGGRDSGSLQTAYWAAGTWSLDAATPVSEPVAVHFDDRAKAWFVGTAESIWKWDSVTAPASKVLALRKRDWVAWDSFAAGRLLLHSEGAHHSRFLDFANEDQGKKLPWGTEVESVALDRRGEMIGIYRSNSPPGLSITKTSDWKETILFSATDPDLAQGRCFFSADGALLALRTGGGRTLIWRVGD